MSAHQGCIPGVCREGKQWERVSCGEASIAPLRPEEEKRLLDLLYSQVNYAPPSPITVTQVLRAVEDILQARSTPGDQP